MGPFCFSSVLQTNGDVQGYAALPEYDAHRPLYARMRHENFLLWIPGKSEKLSRHAWNSRKRINLFGRRMNRTEPVSTNHRAHRDNLLFLETEATAKHPRGHAIYWIQVAKNQFQCDQIYEVA